MITKQFPALLLVTSMGIAEASDEINLNQFAVKYFEAKVATQDPEATPKSWRPIHQLQHQYAIAICHRRFSA